MPMQSQSVWQAANKANSKTRKKVLYYWLNKQDCYFLGPTPGGLLLGPTLRPTNYFNYLQSWCPQCGNGISKCQHAAKKIDSKPVKSTVLLVEQARLLRVRAYC